MNKTFKGIRLRNKTQDRVFDTSRRIHTYTITSTQRLRNIINFITRQHVATDV
jgi:hypothetical protein